MLRLHVLPQHPHPTPPTDSRPTTTPNHSGWASGLEGEVGTCWSSRLGRDALGKVISRTDELGVDERSDVVGSALHSAVVDVLVLSHRPNSLTYEGQHGPPLSALPNRGTGGAADSVGTYLPGGVEHRAGAAAVRLRPARHQVAGRRAAPPADRGSHGAGLAGRPARAVGTAGPGPSGPRLRQLVEPGASRRPAEVQEAPRSAGAALPRAGGGGPQAE